MSHDRGCPCGKEKYEYDDCTRKDCYKRIRAIISGQSECQCSDPLIKCDHRGCRCTVCGELQRVILGDATVAPKPDANDQQVGGDHYKSEYQHWDFIELNGIGYLEAAATKYVARWRRKDGLRDLEKALHYTDKLIELHAQGRRLPRGIAPLEDVHKFAEINKLTALERDVVMYLSRWSDMSVLVSARGCLLRLIDQAWAIENMVADATGQDHPHGYDPERDNV